MEELRKKLEAINTREHFVEFLELLAQDAMKHPDGWENLSLKSYLGATAAWTKDMDGYFHNLGLPTPDNVDWKLFATILMAGKYYE